MIISKRKISKKLNQEMRKNAGQREKRIMDNSTMVYTSNKGRVVSFYAPNKKRTKGQPKGYTADYDKKINNWIN